ncbi:MAG: hypothetical protein WCG81_10510 [Candidatus Angelobacter sp.]
MAHEEAVFSNQHSAVSKNQNQHQNPNQRPFTTEDTESTEKGQTTTQQRAEALALKLAQTYEELTRLLERNPGVKRQIAEGEAKEDKVYQKLKQRLKMADMAPRCQWVKQDGTACRSPQMKRHIYCFAHKQMAEARTLLLLLPPPEDANAIQVGLMRIQKAMIEDTISTKKAGLLLYSMQLALTNVGQTTFGKAKDEEMVRETVDEEEALREEARSSRYSVFSEKQTPTTETQRHGEDPEEEKNLPLINADERGLEHRPKPVEWKPTPDMYRMDTPEGREAYEARFGVKIGASGDRDIATLNRRGHLAIGTPPRAAVPHEHGGTYDPCQMHANQG